MSTTAPEPYAPVDVQAPELGAPGSEVVGPVPVPFVRELASALRAELALMVQARLEARRQHLPLARQFQTDAQGDGFVELYQVPGGATGFLTWLALDVDGSTPATPTTAAGLWHGIFAGQPGEQVLANVLGVGRLLDCQPATPAADAQVPAVYAYGDPYAAPALVGPGTFYLVVDTSAASRLHAVRFTVVIERPEP